MGSTSKSTTHRWVALGNFCNICIVFVRLLFWFYGCVVFDVIFLTVADIK
jgi:hypothetical protein